MPLVTLTLTRSAIAVSAVGLAVRLPWLIVTLPAGVVADRHPPPRVMRWAAAARLPLTAVAVVLALAHLLSVWELVLVAFAVASAGIAVDVSAQSMLPRMVTGEQLRAANQRLQTTQRLASQLVGPAIGGYAAALGSAWGPGAAAALYLATVCALSLMTAPRAPSAQGPGAEPEPEAPAPGRDGPVRALVTDLREGAAYFRHRPDLSRLAVVAGLSNLAFSMCVTILPVWAVAPGALGLSRGDYGLLLGSLAIGGLAGGAVARRLLARLGDEPLLRWGGPLQGIWFLAVAVPSAPVVCIALIYGGAVAMLWNLTVVSYRQTTIPHEIFGRVVAAYRWVTYGVLPLGSLLAGLVAGLAGPVWVFLTAGLITTVGGLPLAARKLSLARPGTPAPPVALEDLCTLPLWPPPRARWTRYAPPNRPVTWSRSSSPATRCMPGLRRTARRSRWPTT